jgi:hypothetical protein
MTRHRKLLIATSLCLVVGLAGCGSGGGYDRPAPSIPPPPPGPPPPPSSPCTPTNPWDYC